MAKLGWMVGVAAVVMGLGGCASSVHTYSAPVPASMTRIAVDVENFRGRVVVDARSRFEVVEVEQNVFVDGDGAARDAGLAAVSLEATLEDAGDGNGVLRVRGLSDRLERDHSSRIFISLPRCDGVRVVNRGGYVELIDVGGSMFVENEGGGVDIRTSRVVNDDVTVLTVDGDVFLQFPEGSEGWVELETFDGRTAVKDEFGTLSGLHDNARLTSGRLGDGENLIQARTNNGILRLLVMPDPLGYSRMIKRHQRDWRDALFLDGSRRYTRNLPEDAYLPEDRAAARAAEAARAREAAEAAAGSASDG